MQLVHSHKKTERFLKINITDTTGIFSQQFAQHIFYHKIIKLILRLFPVSRQVIDPVKNSHMTLRIQMISSLSSQFLHLFPIFILSHKLGCSKMFYIILIASLLPIQHLKVLLFFYFLIDPFTRLFETFIQTFDRNRLQEKILYAHLNSLLCILKLVITGNNNKMSQNLPFLYIRNHIKTSHLRHTDINQNDFRSILFDQRYPQLSISRIPYYGKLIFKVSDILYQCLPEKIFIIYDD